MLSNILFNALLKISKENRDNNYIYSDVFFPKSFIQQQTKKEKQKQLLFKNLFHLDKIYFSKKSKTTKMKDTKDILKNNKKQRNREDALKTIGLFSKTDLNTLSSLPKVNSQKNNNAHLNNIKDNYNVKKFNSTQLGKLHLTPRKQKSFLLDENLLKKINAIKQKNQDSKDGINFHILSINAPKEKIQKSISSLSSNIFNLKNFGESIYQRKFYKIIRLKAHDNKKEENQIQIQSKDTNEDENNYKTKEKLMRKINLRIKSDLNKKELKYRNNDRNLLSLSFPKNKTNKNIPHKIYPMIQINNFREKYIVISDIENHVIKTKEELPCLPLYKKVSVSNNNDIYYYDVNKMYYNQIREYMRHRINWECISDKNIEKNVIINFSWRYYSNRVNYKKYKYNPEWFSNNNNFSVKKLRIINLFERNYEVGNKKYMFLNLINYCDKISMNVFNVVPFTVIINNSPDVELSLEALKEIVDFVNKNKIIDSDIISNRKYNDHFWFDKNYENVSKQYININKNFLSEKNYWIIKPTDLYQGKCIDIFSDFNQINKQCKNIFRGVNTRFFPENNQKEEEDLDNCFNNYNDNDLSNNFTSNLENDVMNININKRKTFYSKMYCSNEIIIQKYLDKPLLYNNRKFDIRCFVLIDHNLNVFFFKEGHLKGCSELYNLNDRNRFIHITNYSLQKKSIKFETYEEGNEISYSDFKKFLTLQNIPLSNFDKMISEMKLLVEISMKAVGNKLLKTNPVLSFEIFGYDFIIDNEFKPWILEINNNPGLVISSSVIQKIIPRMLDDAFRLTIDKIFDTKYDLSCRDEDWKYKSKYPIEGFSDEENIFEFLCNIK